MRLGLHRLVFAHRDDLEGGATALHFSGSASYTAGQHGLWTVPGGGIAAFTLASAPAEDRLTLATHLGTHSRLKRALAALTPGDRVRLFGPLSRFTLGAADDVVMLAQGIGITPFRSMLTQARLTGSDLRSTLIHVGAADGDHGGHPYRAETEAAATEAFFPLGREAFDGHINALPAARPATTYLVAGTAAFVSTATAALNRHGVSRDRIRRDSFYGWSGLRPKDGSTTRHRAADPA